MLKVGDTTILNIRNYERWMPIALVPVTRVGKRVFRVQYGRQEVTFLLSTGNATAKENDLWNCELEAFTQAQFDLVQQDSYRQAALDMLRDYKGVRALHTACDALWVGLIDQKRAAKAVGQ